MLAGLGLTLADYGEQGEEVWPDNQRAVSLFCKVARQWRTGFNGPTALDHNVVFFHMARLDLNRSEWDALFDDVLVMEGEALEVFEEAREEKRQR